MLFDRVFPKSNYAGSEFLENEEIVEGKLSKLAGRGTRSFGRECMNPLLVSASKVLMRRRSIKYYCPNHDRGFPKPDQIIWSASREYGDAHDHLIY
ncbi:hypothetical protein BCON_0207g00240 [Botryotinia convoluta]|uniref:Uncharacterized protein n=1 Tax=Botryotinia convoluta TaxID=54673 RepID=A0A4Z1HL63_9HELO|nr:hypothetical protein BCON_0207g00240 [Botryotinia convoluta]